MSVENIEIIGLPPAATEMVAETTVPPQTGAENAMRGNEGYGDWVMPMAIIALAGVALAIFKNRGSSWENFLEDR